METKNKKMIISKNVYLEKNIYKFEEAENLKLQLWRMPPLKKDFIWNFSNFEIGVENIRSKNIKLSSSWRNFSDGNEKIISRYFINFFRKFIPDGIVKWNFYKKMDKNAIEILTKEISEINFDEIKIIDVQNIKDNEKMMDSLKFKIDKFKAKNKEFNDTIRNFREARRIINQQILEKKKEISKLYEIFYSTKIETKSKVGDKTIKKLEFPSQIFKHIKLKKGKIYSYKEEILKEKDIFVRTKKRIDKIAVKKYYERMKDENDKFKMKGFQSKNKNLVKVKI